LFASNNRLHVVWDNQANGIGYFLDSSDEDDSLSGTSPSHFVGGTLPYSEPGADPGNPTIAGRGNWLVLAYDVAHPNDNTKFGLFYVMSVNNGQTWTPAAFNIPEKVADYPVNDLSSPEADLGLKPSLAITTTGTVTKVFAVWNQSVNIAPGGGFPTNRYRVYFSDVVPALTGVANANTEWSTPISVTGSSESSINPILFVNEGSNAQGHIVYQEESDVNNSNQDQVDVFYEGGINGTIDPEYVLDEFDFEDDDDGDDIGQGSGSSFKSVDQSVIDVPDPNGLDLHYVIYFENEGNLTAVGLSMTDVIPDNTTYNNDLILSGAGSAAYNSGTRTITWSGNVPPAPNGKIRITFSVKLTGVTPPTTVINEAKLSSIGTGGLTFATSRVVTTLARKIQYLPVVRK
jgi:uncharacterized repeat protein (TIGR01451 family)